MFLCVCAGICADKLAAQLGASSETEPGNSLELGENEEVRQKYSTCVIFVDLCESVVELLVVEFIFD